ncbi:MAG: FAD:protein FMN transferase [Candidatus Sumerlaeota bacterium]|nr:FAD:protein FMN transferase [Candidatus Sumerlaeota bacterium]
MAAPDPHSFDSHEAFSPEQNAKAGAGVHCFEHEAMSTAFEIYIAGRPREYARQASAAAFREIERIEGVLSRYVPSSDISRINLLQPGQFTRVGMEAFECLQIATRIYEETSGAFDVTVGPLVDCCRSADGKPRRPHDDELDAARNRIGMDQMILWAGREAVGDPNDRDVLRRILVQGQSMNAVEKKSEAETPGTHDPEMKDLDKANSNEDAAAQGPIIFWAGIAPDIRKLFCGKDSSAADIQVPAAGPATAAGPASAPGSASAAAQASPLAQAAALSSSPPILRLDLGAIGKGYALDKAAELLREWSIEAALIHAGTSTALGWGSPGAAARLEPGQEGWPVGIGGDWVEDPARRRILLKDAALSGSGTEVKGSHILDGRAARPASGHLAAWAVYPSYPETCGAAVSDALSTAFMVMRTQEVEAFCAAHPEVSALAVSAGATSPELHYFGSFLFLPGDPC